ncbi:MAG: hypothetical protein QNJ19_16500 [Woeseiaceae bacterium]|nr:hypothetical protein [Woeseiaceae bacterium]
MYSKIPPALLPFLLVAAVFASTTSSAEVVRYQSLATGNVTITGNTLGLSKASGANSPGDLGSIGTFITTNTSSVDSVPASSPSWPSGTTNAWAFGGSSAVLSIPPGSTVLHAELVWGGSTSYVEDVTASLDVAVGLEGPAGTCGSITPDPATAVTISEMPEFVAYEYYLRSSDVTSCVAAQGAGAWVASGVPATQHESVDSLNAAGWALIVAYRDTAEPLRTLAIIVDGSMVHELSSSNVTISGLATPDSGPVTGRLVAAALEGDADLDGDQLGFGPAGGPLVQLAGVNNPVANFFASQINGADGLLDSSGSFGTSNHDAPAGSNTIGARQGFDTTGIALSSASGHLVHGQSAADLQASTSGDAFVSMAYGLAVDRAAPTIPGLAIGGAVILAAGILATGVRRSQR